MTPVFHIVTPAYNSAAFIDETIQSVVFQTGNFRIRYHVQDGGSRDETVAKLERWSALLGAGTLPLLNAGVEFTFASEKDGGMYDAINRGFARLAPAGVECMTYINSDDRLLPGAMQFAATVFASQPDIAWLGGRPCEMNERGELMRIHGEQVYSLAALRAGLHDGRSLPFVMQEGTFWRAALWQKCGGFQATLRQAGDWDLWRRLAAETPYVTTDVVLAAHRRREAQLTADMTTYYREVDETIAREIGDLHSTELQRYREWAASSETDRDQRFYGPILRFHTAASHGGSGQWQLEMRPCRAPLKTSIAVTNGFTHPMLPAEFTAGFGSACDAEYPLNLLPGYHVTVALESTLRFRARTDGLHRIFLRARILDPGIRLKLANATRTILNVEMPMTNHDRDVTVIAESVLTKGPNQITMTLEGANPEKPPVIVVISAEAMSTV
jgi:glycosyltransferase involved in cell wall biosynthesis